MSRPAAEDKLRATRVFFNVSNIDAALAFYVEVLGLPLTARFGDSWAEVDAGTVFLGLHRTEDPISGHGGGVVSFTVGDVEAVASYMRANGATVGEIRTPDRGKFFMARDPDGNLLHFIEFDPNWVLEHAYDTGR